jgi:hypothetical protein
VVPPVTIQQPQLVLLLSWSQAFAYGLNNMLTRHKKETVYTRQLKIFNSLPFDQGGFICDGFNTPPPVMLSWTNATQWVRARGSIKDQAQRCQESQKLRNIKTFDSVGLSRLSHMREAGYQQD